MDNTLIDLFILFWNKCIFEHKKTDRTNLYSQYILYVMYFSKVYLYSIFYFLQRIFSYIFEISLLHILMRRYILILTAYKFLDVEIVMGPTSHVEITNDNRDVA